VPFDVGFRKAKELLFESRFVDAEEARELGFVNRVVEAEKLREETLAFAERVGQNGYTSLRMAKLAVNKAQDVAGFSTAMEAAFADFLVLARIGGHPRKLPDKPQLPAVGLALRDDRDE
jgi:enoyl-CoA hydratase